MKQNLKTTVWSSLPLLAMIMLLTPLANFAQVSPPPPQFQNDSLSSPTTVCDSLNQEVFITFNLTNTDPGQQTQITSVPGGEVNQPVFGPGPHTVSVSAQSDSTILVAWRGSLNNSDTLVVYHCNFSSLPVTWGYFTAKQFNNKGIALNWTTLTEMNADHFVVRRKIDNGEWSIIASDIKAAGNSQETEYYYFTDTDAWEYGVGMYYYQIGQLDVNGRDTSWTHIEETYFDPGAITMVPYPNPCSEVLNIAVTGDVETWTYTLVDATGRTIQTGKIENTMSTQIITTEYSSGLYFLKVTAANDVFNHRIVVR